MPAVICRLIPHPRRHTTGRLYNEISRMLEKLTTELSHPDSEGIDGFSTSQILEVMNRADTGIAETVRRAIPHIGVAIDAIAAALDRGGSLLYFGAGTSGRLAVLDAAECVPTFHTPPDLVRAVIAGG